MILVPGHVSGLRKYYLSQRIDKRLNEPIQYCSPELLASWVQRIVFFLSFFYEESMGANDPHEVASMDPRGIDWQDLCRGPLDIATN